MLPRLECEVDVLTRRMKLAWFRDLAGDKLAVTRGELVLVQEPRYGVQTTAVSSTLTISGMRAEDAGSWHCFRCTGDCSYFVFIRDQPLQLNHTLHAAGGQQHSHPPLRMPLKSLFDHRTSFYCKAHG